MHASRVVRESVVVVLALTCAAPIAAAGEPAAATPPLLDEGLLDPAWFDGGKAVEFRQTPEIDYLWVQSGFELQGKRVYFESWPAPRIPAARDDKDVKAAQKFAAEFPPALRETLSKKLTPPVIPVGDPAEADVVLAGRVADCNAGNPWAYVWPATTIDIRVRDARSGELLAAVHNRKVARPQTTLHATALLKLCREGLQNVYAGAKPAS